MGNRAADAKVRSKEPTPYDTPFDTRQAHINASIAAEWLDLPKHVAWHWGYRLDQVICRQNEDGWQLIVKAHRRGRPYVAFVQAGTMVEAFELGGEFASRGVFTWKPDEWPSKWLKRLLGIV